MKKKKKNIVILYAGVILTFLIIFAILAIKFTTYTEYSTVFNHDGSHLDKLNTGDEIIQEVPIRSDYVDDIGIYFADYLNNNNTGKITITIRDSQGNIYTEKEIDVSKLVCSDYTKIKIDQPIYNLKEDKIFVHISVDSMGDNTTLTCMTNMGKEYKTIYNDEETEATLALRVFYKVNIVFKLFSYGLFFILTSLIIAVIFMIMKKDICYHRLYLLCAIGLGAIYMFMIPCYMVPDEPHHIITAYNMSNKIMNEEYAYDDGIVCMRFCDINTYYTCQPDYLDISNISKNIFGMADKENTYMIKNNLNLKPLKGSEEAYLASGLGITLGRIIGLNGSTTLLLGRIFNYIIYAMITFFAIKTIPYGKNILFIISTFPVVMQQAVSYSYDSLVIAVSMMFVALLTYFMDEKYELKIKHMILFAVICLLISHMKNSAYMPIALLCILPIIKFRKNKEKKKIVFWMISILILIILFKIGNIFYNNITSETTSTTVKTGYYSIGFLLENTKNTIMVIVNTLWSKIDFYMFSSTANSLGWLVVYTPYYVSIIYWIIIVLSMTKRNKVEENYTLTSKVVACIMSLASFGGICLALLLSITPKTESVVLGVQGRYFIPIIILLSILLRTDWITIKKDISKQLIICTLLLQFFTIYSVIMYYIR